MIKATHFIWGYQVGFNEKDVIKFIFWRITMILKVDIDGIVSFLEKWDKTERHE